ncbi:hypothetical protein pb186bvf_015224 [Paramecium bursaria]
MCLPYKFLKEYASNYSGLVLILSGIYCTMKAIKLLFTNVAFDKIQINNDSGIAIIIILSILTSINGLIDFFVMLCIRTKYISQKDRLKLYLKHNINLSILLLISCIGVGIYYETQLNFVQNSDYQNFQQLYNNCSNKLNESVINYQFMTNPVDTSEDEQIQMMYFSYLEMNYFCGGWTDENNNTNNTQTFSLKNQAIMSCSYAHQIYRNDKLDSTLIICLILIVFFLITLQLKCCLSFHKNNVKKIKKIQINQNLN